MTSKRLEEGGVDEEFPPQVQQVKQGAQDIQVPIERQGNEVLVVSLEMTNGEIREDLFTLARALTTHVNRGIDP